MKELAGKIAFVTGGASGIGFGLVRSFLEEGMTVIVVDLNQRHLDEVRGMLKGSNAVHFIRADVADREQMRAAADEAVRLCGKIHLLCNNAGVGGGGSVDNPDFDAWDRAIRTNLGGVVNGVKIIAPLIKAHGEGGHIVNTASMAGLIALPADGGTYSTAKFAVRGLTESLRLSLAPHGIGVSCLCPGLTRSRIMDSARDDNPSGQSSEIDSLFDGMNGAMDPMEVGAAVVRGIRENALYILTHSEFRDEVAGLFDDILAAFPGHQQIHPARLAFEEGRRRMTEDLRHLPVKG